MKDYRFIRLKENTLTLIQSSQALQQEHLALRTTLKSHLVVLRTSLVALQATNQVEEKYNKLQ